MSYLPIGGSGGGGFKLGPAQNIFDASSGDLAAAEKLRDDYATANPSWLAEYDGNSELNVLLLYTDSGSPVGTYFVRSGNEWRLNSSVKGLRGPKGDEGKEGPQGPPGGKLPHKDLDIGVYGDMNASEWIAEGNFVYAFNNPKLSELSNSPANVYDYGSDPDRTFSIVHGEQTVNTHDGKTYVTRTFVINEADRPKAYSREGYVEDGTFDRTPWQPINGMIVSKKLTDGSFQNVPSGFMKFGGGLKPVFDREITTVNAVAPFSEVVEIFDNAQVSSPEDNKTYVYSTVDLEADHEFWLNLDPADVVEGYTISIAVAPNSMSSITLFMEKSKVLKAPILPGSTIVIKRLAGQNSFTIFKSAGGTFLNVDALYLDLSPTNWKDQPINTYFVGQGTYANISDKVNGKTGRMIAQVINTDIHDNPNSMIVHVYTLVSGEDSINGLQFKRVADTKENFLNAKLEPVGDSGGGTGGNGFPDNGSIDDLSSDFKSLAVGKWYVDGWQNTSNLPNDWANEDRVAALTVFGGYEGTDNGAYWILASHRKGIYSAVTSAGVTSDWYKLDNANPQPIVTRGFNVDSSNPGEVIASNDSNHDVIAINGNDDLVLGTRSATVKSLTLATGDTKIGVYRKDENSGSEIVDRIVMASELDQFRGLDDYWVEGAKTDGQIMKGTHPETAKEVFAGVDDVFMWKYSSYTYMMPLSFVVHKSTVSTQAGTLAYSPQTKQFTLNAESASGSVTDLGWTIGGGASAVHGDDTVPVTYRNLLTSGQDIAAGNYALTGASPADLFTFQWSTSTADTVTIPLSIVPEGEEFTVNGTGDRVKLVRVGSNYTLNITSNIEALGFIGHTVGMNQGSTVINQGGKPRQKRTLYIDGADYVITEDDIQKDIVIQCEPFIKTGEEYVSTVTFPTLEVIKKYYWIPGVNDADKDSREWSIMDLQISAYVDPESVKTGVNKLILKSADNAFGWGTNTVLGNYEGCYIFRRHDDTSENDDHVFNFMRREVGGSTTGPMAGYTLQSAKENHVYDLGTPTPPKTKNINDAVNFQLRSDADGKEYVSIDRANPVTTSDESTDSLTLVRVITAETDSALPVVQKLSPGTLGSGFSLCEDGAAAGTEILQIASGTYTLEQMTFAQAAPVGSIVYVGDDGKLTLAESPYHAGWVINGGVVIDIDIYNASLSGEATDTFDILTTRVLKVHEGPDYPEVFLDIAITGYPTCNTEIHAPEDTHFYSKDKDSGDLTEAFQVKKSGDVEFKNGIEFKDYTRIDCQDELGLVLQGDTLYAKSHSGYEHFFIEDGNFNVKSKKIQKVRDGIADDDATTVRQLSAALQRITDLESTVASLQQAVEIEGQKLKSLEESNGNSLKDFDLYSSTPNELRLDMEQIDGGVLTQTIELGNTPPPGPTPGPGDQVTIYWGWDVHSRGLIEAQDILNYEGNEERTAQDDITAETLLTTTLLLTRSDDTYKYSYVAFPKGLVDPDPTSVEYSGFVDTWPSRQMTINGMQYIVLVSEWPNKSLDLDMKIHQ